MEKSILQNKWSAHGRDEEVEIVRMVGHIKAARVRMRQARHIHTGRGWGGAPGGRDEARRVEDREDCGVGDQRRRRACGTKAILVKSAKMTPLKHVLSEIGAQIVRAKTVCLEVIHGIKSSMRETQSA